jgi:LmbE family N-acetylglucosaminyl deacetylase
MAPSERKLRVIAFGAHPDDCEWGAGGTAAKWAALGHAVKFVSMTNGDLGHWQIAGGPLARRRREEVWKADGILGVESLVLDTHDGELLPTLENRKAVVRLIREWRADVVLCHRPHDYHPDHRYAAILVQDAAYMVTVPFYCQDVPSLPKNPLFLYYADEFTIPNAFRPDVVVATDDVIEKKLGALSAFESQVFEGGCEGSEETQPRDPDARAAYRKSVREKLAAHFAEQTDRFRGALREWYGEPHASRVRFAEAFEICEFSRSWAAISRTAQRADREELRRLFPFA